MDLDSKLGSYVAAALDDESRRCLTLVAEHQASLQSNAEQIAFTVAMVATLLVDQDEETARDVFEASRKVVGQFEREMATPLRVIRGE